MATLKVEPEDLEVTVEVLPQTVNDIVYMSEEVNSAPGSFDGNNDEERNIELYKLDTVDPVNVTQLPLVLDESQTFVILPQESENFEGTNIEYTITPEGYLKRLEQAEEVCMYSCQFCNYRCISLDELGAHASICKRSKDKYVCNVCGEIFERAQVLSHHFRQKHQKPALICNICGCPCVSETALTCHYKKHEPKAFSCDVCDAEYDNAVALNNHLKTHTTTLLYACNKCGTGFSSTSEISVHLRTVHPTPSRRKNPVENSLEESGDSGEKITRMRKLKLKFRKERN